MFHRVWLLMLAVGTFAIGTDGYVIAGLLPEMGRDLGVSDSQAGQFVTVFALAYAIGAPLLGVAIGSLPRRPLLIGSLALFAVSNVAAALVDSYEMMLAVRVLAALTAAVFTPAAAAAVPPLVPVEERGRALGTVGAGIAVATAVGVPLGTLIGGAFGWRTTFLVVAGLSVLATAGLLWKLPPMPPEPAAGIKTRLSVARARGIPTALGLTVLWIAGAFTVLTFMSPVLEAVGGIHGSVLSIWLMIFGVAAVAGNALGGRAADRLPTTRLMVISTGGLTIALASFGALGSLGVHGSLGAALAAVALVVWGIFGWSFAPLQQHRLVELAPQSAGIVLSLNASAIYAGISLGGFLGSLALDHVGTTAVGWTAAGLEILAVAAAAAIAVRAGRHQRQGTPTPSADSPTNADSTSLPL
ncbi:MFS transporter [Streptomyces sp. NPDC018045]|uniref:MFS transporter n=1 Tax=Streptomyces sp. NPDC018045 TaxID=3365037 RepID=UPI00379772CD